MVGQRLLPSGGGHGVPFEFRFTYRRIGVVGQTGWEISDRGSRRGGDAPGRKITAETRWKQRSHFLLCVHFFSASTGSLRLFSGLVGRSRTDGHSPSSSLSSATSHGNRLLADPAADAWHPATGRSTAKTRRASARSGKSSRIPAGPSRLRRCKGGSSRPWRSGRRSASAALVVRRSAWCRQIAGRVAAAADVFQDRPIKLFPLGVLERAVWNPCHKVSNASVYGSSSRAMPDELYSSCRCSVSIEFNFSGGNMVGLLGDFRDDCKGRPIFLP